MIDMTAGGHVTCRMCKVREIMKTTVEIVNSSERHVRFKLDIRCSWLDVVLTLVTITVASIITVELCAVIVFQFAVFGSSFIDIVVRSFLTTCSMLVLRALGQRG